MGLRAPRAEDPSFPHGSPPTLIHANSAMDVTSPPDRCHDNQAKTSAFDFVLALQAFLCQNRIDSVGPFRMRVKPTSSNNWALLVEGEASVMDHNVLDQLNLGFPWPPSPPELDGVELAEASSSVASSGTSFPEYMAMDGSCLGDPGLTRFFNPTVVPNLASGLHHMESDEAGLAMQPTAVDVQSLSPESLQLQVKPTATAGRTSHMPRRNLPSPTPTHRRVRTTRDGRHKQSMRLNSADTEADLIVRYLSQHVISEDYYALLGSNLPRWTTQGIWNEHGTRPDASSQSPYVKLEQAYRVVCQINSRMSDDLVRDRMGLIRLHLEYIETHRAHRGRHASGANTGSTRPPSTVGRGNASQVIDLILKSIHEEWNTLDETRRAELRAKFHERKKYGKRWSQLTDALGPGILLICSTKLASAVRGTAVTARMLDAVIERFDRMDPAMVKVTSIVSPLAAALLENKGFAEFETATMMHQIQSACPRVFE
ncbi:uncharacterized protein DSM5745_01694 [Aspergillus mulundensis]|uniref:Uncharacterized protein n=1 Tax=Aspergillus mulundensis TaxID=1810919 RepID=A0A3D8SUD7_9EURO|nr:hypothetical protein DSM5745_01694 [Aspergillus mulundensis]RDW89919.1 hypothetical protein DSM5745_01694 [Aspergillus mulundensis]